MVDKIPFRVADDAEQGPALLQATLTDAAGDRTSFSVRLPAPPGE